jgi:CRP/FNR family cyclic AMP-dependent transcriptional regulator
MTNANDIGLTPDQLRSIPALRTLTDEQLTAFCGLFEPFDLAEGQVLFNPGDEPQALYLLTEGEVRLTQDPAEEFVLRPPTLIGELGAVTGLTPRNSRAVASDGARLFKVASAAVQAFIGEHRDLALAM